MSVANTSNSSEVDYRDKIKVDVSAVLPAYLIVLATCLLGNILVCITIMKNQEMRKKRWYYFLINLSISDMGLALFTPVYLLQSAGVDMGDAGCKLGIHIIDTFLVTSVLTLGYISIDRYICICHPQVTRLRRVHPVWINIGLWVSAIIFLSPFSIYCYRGKVASNSCDCRSAWPAAVYYRVYKFVLASVWFHIPFLTMIFCYSKIILQLWGKKGERSSIAYDQSGKKKRSIKMMILATSLFFTSWFPYTVLYLIKEMNVGDPRIVGKCWLFIQLIAFANSAWNPFTYCVFSIEFREGFKRVFFWRKERKYRAQEVHSDALGSKDALEKKRATRSEHLSDKTGTSQRDVST
ncbi:neuropeptide FF receptor 2-like [Rhopilema esculentum]|uniref:neuropeptide FF receptor 2-like n=1 Tax=Rhopilema esculentum TaxID=499914 RepID=UPI0031D9773D